MFYQKKSKEEIEQAREKLKQELARERESLRVLKAEEELTSFLKSKIEKRFEASPLPPSPQELREKEKEKMFAEYEKEAKEREADFDRQIARKTKKSPGYEYS